MQDQTELRRKALKALEKKAAYGDDFELKNYQVTSEHMSNYDSLEEIDDETKQTLLNVGVIPSGKERSGTLIMTDNSISHSSLSEDSVELTSTRKARDKYKWFDDYFWKLVPVDKDKYTAKSYLENADGYFIRAPANTKTSMPVQTCLMLGSKNISQTVHNIVIVEENAQLDIITGCATKKGVEKAIHLGISEMYIKKGATLNFTMIHNWSEQIDVRPRTVVHVEEGGTFINNYISLKPVKSIQTYPTVKLEGKGAFARLNTVAVAHPGSELDLGSKVLFNSPETKAELISRTITTGGKVIARGEMIGNAINSKGHLECHGLVLNDEGVQRAIPILEANVQDIELSHEAAVGKIAKEQVEYLMARGLTEEQAVGMIIRGFLDVGIKGLPPELEADINDTIKKIGESSI